MRLEWLPKADDDLARQVAYISEDSPLAAIDIYHTVKRSVAKLEAFPRSGRPGRMRGTREMPVTGTPFLVVYRVEATAVLIMRVMHGAQKWPPSKKSGH
jgi:toxin ParE1/3/4